MVFGSVCVHVIRSRFARHAQRVCQLPHKRLVCITFGAAELMIEMGTDHVEMAAFPQRTEEAQQRDRIRSARNGDDHPGTGGQQLKGSAIRPDVVLKHAPDQLSARSSLSRRSTSCLLLPECVNVRKHSMAVARLPHPFMILTERTRRSGSSGRSAIAFCRNIVARSVSRAAPRAMARL